MFCNEFTKGIHLVELGFAFAMVSLWRCNLSGTTMGKTKTRMVTLKEACVHNDEAEAMMGSLCSSKRNPLIDNEGQH